MTLAEARNIIVNPKSTKKDLAAAGKYVLMLLLGQKQNKTTSTKTRQKIHKSYPSSIPYSVRGSMDLTATYRPYEGVRASDDLTRGND